MSHVDEGELTAYADGAFAPTDADGQRIEAHLVTCANCRNRLAQVQALSGRAAEILALAAPVDVAMPSFESVRAAAKARQRTRFAALPMTWAASVILALGLGWFGRDALESGGGLEMAASERAAAVQPAADQAEPAPEVLMQTPAATATASARQQETRQPLRAAGTGVAADASVMEEDISVAGIAASDAPPPPASPAPGLIAVEVRREADFAVAGSAGAVEYITAAEAERRSIALHAVPELEVLRVGVRANEISVEQKLPDGKILTVTSVVVIEPQGAAEGARTQRPATQEAAGEARKARQVAPTANRDNAIGAVTLLRGNVRVTLMAPLSDDSLRALAAKVR